MDTTTPLKRHGELTTDETPITRNGRVHWHCRCDCGIEKLIRRDSIVYGRTRSCGCSMNSNRSPGVGRTPIYKCWWAIKNRCYNPNCHAFADYGGRGITMCDRWRDSFEAFRDDVGERPSADHSIDRIDNSGNYEPGNVRWATMTTQSRNRRSTLMLTYMGRTMCATEWAEELGLNRQTLYNRLGRGWPVDIALSTPPLSA